MEEKKMQVLKKCKECPKIPVVRKCCFCVPVRKGVIIFGYVNLVLSLLSFPLLVYLLAEYIATGKAVDDSHMDPMIHLPLTIAFVVIDVSMNVVLLIGAHKKKRILLKVYFFFCIVFQLLTLCVDLAYFDFREYLENTLYFLFLGLNIYLLFLVHSTVLLLEQNTEVQYVVYENQPQRL